MGDAVTTHLPFHCARCGLDYGEGGIALGEGVKGITFVGNSMSCPRCGKSNQQSLPAGTYDIEGGRFKLVRRLTEDVLSTPATREDIARLLELVRDAQAENAAPEAVADRVESETPFTALATTLRQYLRDHPPGWGAWLITLLLTLLPLVLSGSGDSTHEPGNRSGEHRVTPADLDRLSDKIVREIESQERSVVRRPGRDPARNKPCPCGSGVKFKRCHGSPDVGESRR